MSFLLACCLVITAVVSTAQAQQVNCRVDTGSGTIDLAQIPQMALTMTQNYRGALSDHVFKFNLCSASPGAPASRRELQH